MAWASLHFPPSFFSFLFFLFFSMFWDFGNLWCPFLILIFSLFFFLFYMFLFMSSPFLLFSHSNIWRVSVDDVPTEGTPSINFFIIVFTIFIFFFCNTILHIRLNTFGQLNITTPVWPRTGPFTWDLLNRVWYASSLSLLRTFLWYIVI